MNFKLTSNWQYSHHDKDGCHRNYLSFYLNDILILKQKIPFDTDYEHGFDERTSIYDAYLLNGKLHQKRCRNYGCGHPDNNKTEIREVSYPISKKILAQFNIPQDFRIDTSN
jgi:hypothetical protein